MSRSTHHPDCIHQSGAVPAHFPCSCGLIRDLIRDRDALLDALLYAHLHIADECACGGLKCRLPHCESCQAEPSEIDWAKLNPALATAEVTDGE